MISFQMKCTCNYIVAHSMNIYKIFVFVYCRNIMMDVRRDNRVLSIVNKPGLRNLLTTMVDQLQRCQKSLNEFLEVRYCIKDQFLSLKFQGLWFIVFNSTFNNISVTL